MAQIKFPSLRAYLRTMTPEQQVVFATKCGTTIGYLRKLLSKGSVPGAALIANIVFHSDGLVLADELCPACDWSVFTLYSPAVMSLRIKKAASEGVSLMPELAKRKKKTRKHQAPAELVA